ncbi:lipoprotein [Ancylobacter sp. 6x-1]|uniref:Lipoprotein n=1 Tax=Ancylobacter crimeensis TaxID=2579147 RepID=A0ABT0DD03_9HYPH|nr:lipoprotein [Ancylobacter crimeensis]
MPRPASCRVPRILALAMMLGAAAALGGCGVKGPLEPPPGSVQPGPDGKPGKDPGIQKPHKPFLLDPLL